MKPPEAAAGDIWLQEARSCWRPVHHVRPKLSVDPWSWLKSLMHVYPLYRTEFCFPFPAFTLLRGSICGWGCRGVGGLGQTLVLWDCAVPHLLPFSLCRACRQQYLVGLFLIAVKKTESWLESKVVYLAQGCAPFILSA